MAVTNLERLQAKAEELQSRVWDLERRTADIESVLGAFIMPFSSKTPVKGGSRWVLELFPDEVEEWRRAIRTIPTERLSEKERSFLRSLDYYIASERKLTVPMLRWLLVIRSKVGGAIPTVPMPTGSHHSSNPYAECPACGYTWSPPPNYCPRCLTIIER